MQFAITFTTDLTVDQYDEIWRMLQEQDDDHPKGRMSHVGFEEDGVMRVVDVWDSMAEFEAFGQTLMPIIEKVGGTATPSVAAARHFQIG